MKKQQRARSWRVVKGLQRSVWEAGQMAYFFIIFIQPPDS